MCDMHNIKEYDLKFFFLRTFIGFPKRGYLLSYVGYDLGKTLNVSFFGTMPEFSLCGGLLEHEI